MNALVVGAALGALGVAAGAFGAHALKAQLGADKLAIFETGARYHLLHALALLAAGLLARHAGEPLTVTTQLFTWGIVLFSGSLYALALGAPPAVGLLTPVGGAALIAGWVALALAARGI